MKNLAKILVSLLLAFLLAGLAMLNAEGRVTVALTPSWALQEVPVFLVILGSMFVGVVIAGLVAVVDHLRCRTRVRTLQRRLRDLEDERAGGERGTGTSVGGRGASPGGG